MHFAWESLLLKYFITQEGIIVLKMILDIFVLFLTTDYFYAQNITYCVNCISEW